MVLFQTYITKFLQTYQMMYKTSHLKMNTIKSMFLKNNK